MSQKTHPEKEAPFPVGAHSEGRNAPGQGKTEEFQPIASHRLRSDDRLGFRRVFFRSECGDFSMRHRKIPGSMSVWTGAWSDLIGTVRAQDEPNMKSDWCSAAIIDATALREVPGRRRAFYAPSSRRQSGRKRSGGCVTVSTPVGTVDPVPTHYDRERCGSITIAATGLQRAKRNQNRTRNVLPEGLLSSTIRPL